MRIFKIKNFAKFAKGERIKDATLTGAIERAVQGSIDADLGGHLIKQRVARQGQGKRDGYRTLIAFHGKDRSVFLYGFAKNERDNISPKELKTLQELAKTWLEASEKDIAAALESGLLTEIENGKDKAEQVDRRAS